MVLLQHCRAEEREVPVGSALCDGARYGRGELLRGCCRGGKRFSPDVGSDGDLWEVLGAWWGCVVCGALFVWLCDFGDGVETGVAGSHATSAFGAVCMY